jgi:ketosteroid isomerase-like protein
MPATKQEQHEKNVPDTPLGRLYREHINLILKKDIEGILDQYMPDALLISSFSADRKAQYYRGRDQLREHFKGILGLQGLEVEIAFWGETENTLMIVEAVKVTDNKGETAAMRFADSWVLRDGKIAIHFAGMVQYPDGSIA